MPVVKEQIKGRGEERRGEAHIQTIRPHAFFRQTNFYTHPSNKPTFQMHLSNKPEHSTCIFQTNQHSTGIFQINLNILHKPFKQSYTTGIYIYRKSCPGVFTLSTKKLNNT